MLTSKIFYIASLVAALAAAAKIWDGSNPWTTAGLSVAGGAVMGAVAWFMYGKVADFLHKRG